MTLTAGPLEDASRHATDGEVKTCSGRLPEASSSGQVSSQVGRSIGDPISGGGGYPPVGRVAVIAPAGAAAEPETPVQLTLEAVA